MICQPNKSLILTLLNSVAVRSLSDSSAASCFYICMPLKGIVGVFIIIWLLSLLN